jgi:hypothetical protein
MRVRPQVRFRGETDIDRQARPAGSVENDPNQTLGDPIHSIVSSARVDSYT